VADPRDLFPYFRGSPPSLLPIPFFCPGHVLELCAVPLFCALPPPPFYNFFLPNALMVFYPGGDSQFLRFRLLFPKDFLLTGFPKPHLFLFSPPVFVFFWGSDESLFSSKQIPRLSFFPQKITGSRICPIFPGASPPTPIQCLLFYPRPSAESAPGAWPLD